MLQPIAAEQQFINNLTNKDLVHKPII